MSTRLLILICLLVLVVSIIGALLYPAVQDTRGVARRLHQAKDILVASRLYAQDHGGHMPSTVAQLSALTDKQDGHRYYDPSGWTGSFLQRAAHELEIVAPALSDTAAPQTVFLRERMSDRDGRRVVGYIDASAMLIVEH